MALAVLIGVATRAFLVLRADFPLSDGGLFFAMARDLIANGFRLPDATSYNQAQIPFAYPPLGIYVAALIGHGLSIPLASVFRYLPLIVDCGTIPAFFGLARALLPDRASASYATCAFALMPLGFFWEVMGGGVTRAFGLLFALLLLRSVTLLYRRGANRDIVLCVLFASGAALSHPTLAWFAGYSSLLLLAFYGRSARAAVRSVIVGLGVAALTAPWWLTVVSQHGAGTFFAAGGDGIASISGLFDLPGALAGIPGFLALCGLLWAISNARWFLLVWPIAISLLDQRDFVTDSSVAIALLAGLGAVAVLGSTTANLSSAGPVPLDSRFPRLRRVLFGVAISLVLVAMAVTSLITSMSTLPWLSSGERTAMAWVEIHTPPTSAFAVIEPEPVWQDRSAEWFPALTGRISVAVPQGYEWVGHGEYRDRNDQFATIEACASQGTECLDAWTSETGRAFSYVYVAKRDDEDRRPSSYARSLLESLRGDPRYATVYDGSGATIFQRIDGT